MEPGVGFDGILMGPFQLGIFCDAIIFLLSEHLRHSAISISVLYVVTSFLDTRGKCEDKGIFITLQVPESANLNLF